VLDGVVYWSEGLSVGPDHVYAYDLATRQRHTLDRSATLDILGPEVLGGGIYWSKADRTVTYRAGNLPPGFDVLVGKGYGGLITDGNRQAWVQPIGQRFVVKMRIGNAAPVTVLGPSTDPVEVSGLVGPYLLVGSTVLDTRTGAATDLNPTADTFADVAAGGGTIAVSLSGASPVRQGLLAVLNEATLPGLRC